MAKDNTNAVRTLAGQAIHPVACPVRAKAPGRGLTVYDPSGLVQDP
jgi:hypothetical protein